MYLRKTLGYVLDGVGLISREKSAKATVTTAHPRPTWHMRSSASSHYTLATSLPLKENERRIAVQIGRTLNALLSAGGLFVFRPSGEVLN